MNEKELKQRNEEVVKELFSLVNKMTNDKDLAEAFKKHLSTEHPTLAQGFFRMVREVCVEYSKRPHFDLRNEASGKFCKRVAEMEDMYFPLV